MELSGRSVFITGGAQGIGRAVTEALLSKGAKVHCPTSCLPACLPACLPIYLSVCSCNRVTRFYRKLKTIKGLVPEAGVGQKLEGTGVEVKVIF